MLIYTETTKDNLVLLPLFYVVSKSEILLKRTSVHTYAYQFINLNAIGQLVHESHVATWSLMLGEQEMQMFEVLNMSLMI